MNKYCSLAADFHQMCNMPVTIIPVVLGCTGVVSFRCLQFIRKIPWFTLKLLGHLTESCADWDFTGIKSNTHSPMNYFLCNCTCHSQFYFTVLLYMQIIIYENFVVVTCI